MAALLLILVLTVILQVLTTFATGHLNSDQIYFYTIKFHLSPVSGWAEWEQ